MRSIYLIIGVSELESSRAHCIYTVQPQERAFHVARSHVMYIPYAAHALDLCEYRLNHLLIIGVSELESSRAFHVASCSSHVMYMCS